jgi:hypothetical protein
MIAGGSLMIVLWPVFTTLHGPTSVYEERSLFGMEGLFWGGMMEGPSSLLMAAGLAGSYDLLTWRETKVARIGFWLAMIGLVLPGVIDLAVLAPIPPILAPLLGVGLLLLAVGNRSNPSLSRFSRRVLAALALLQFFAFLWTALVRPDVLDRIYGYRIYGVGANVLFGIGWIMLGSSLLRRTRQAQKETAAVPSD